MLVASHILTFPLVPLLPETAQKDTKNDPSLAESCQACTFVCEHTGFLLGRSPQKGGFTPFWVSPGCAPGLPEVSPQNGGGHHQLGSPHPMRQEGTRPSISWACTSLRAPVQNLRETARAPIPPSPSPLRPTRSCAERYSRVMVPAELRK
jgi:hypothetical protein